jgi:hypothetical protein
VVLFADKFATSGKTAELTVSKLAEVRLGNSLIFTDILNLVYFIFIATIIHIRLV